jgi:hypothetical protein
MIRTIQALAATALLCAGCSDQQPTTPGQTADLARTDLTKDVGNASIYWNDVARATTASGNFNAFQGIRGYAVVALAQYNAAMEAENSTDPLRPSVHAAISSASVVALTYLFPSQAAALEQQLAAYIAKWVRPGLREGDAASGEALGRAVAAEVVDDAKTDRFFDPVTVTVPTGPGIWSSTTPPVGPGFGLARTFFLQSASQFRPPPHPAFNSPAFLAALNEVRHFADTRTPEQDANTKAWNLPAGTQTPAGYWNQEATRLALKYRRNALLTARMLALMNMVSFDAVVAAHEAKYHYWLLRPTMADPGIVPSFPNPNFPAYPSNHAAISAGMAAILGATFPAERKRLDALAEEAALSRVLGGIHYRFDGDAGVTLGRQVAAWALQRTVNHNRSLDTR